MLRELHISNLAVIADARIELHAGLNCFTGATGAGKSLVIGAVEVLLGLRSPAEMLRNGADEGRVSGVFEVRSKDLLARIEQSADVNIKDDGGELLITRRLYASGRSSININGQPITLAMLKHIAEHLVDVHGQHDHQYLLKPANQLDVLDQFGKLAPLRLQYNDVYEQLRDAKDRLADLSAGVALREQQIELYRFQVEEIDSAEVDPAEYAELQARTAVLTNLEKLKRDAGASQAALYEADGSVLERLKAMTGVLSELAELDPALKPIAQSLRDSTIQLEEVAFDLSRYLDRLDLDPAELTEVNDRLNTLNRVLNKYGGSPEETLVFRAEIGQKLAALEHATDEGENIVKQIEPLRKDLKKLGEDLSRQRKLIATKLGPLIEKELAELGMERAKFNISFAPATSGIADEDLPASAGGFDAIEFLVQTNPGLSPQPLRKIASGGELSRIMLGLKSILAQSDRISVLVFDEIDSNVGGRLGAVIGSKLRSLAVHHQVLCITHLPQIASYGDRHLTVRKNVVGNETHTTVRVMEGAERLEELAEMIGGQRITEATRAQARELLDSAADKGSNGHTNPRPPSAARSRKRSST